MYGQSVFTDEVLRTVEKELNTYLNNEQLDIFAQPLPLDNDARALDMNNPADVSFAFEIGLKPSFEIDAKKIKVTRYVIDVTNEMIDQEVERLQIRHGKMTEPETVTGDDNVLNVKFIQCDENGNETEGGITKDNSLLVKYFEESFRKNFIGKKNNDTVVLQLDKAFEDKEKEAILADLGLTAADGNRYFKLLVERAEMNAEFFATVYPNTAVTTAEYFRAEVKKEIENYYAQQARNQVQDQIYHHLVDHTHMEFPESFLKRWLQTGGEKPKTSEEAEQEYPTFISQLKWTLVS
jgi:trigger factor